MSVAFLPSGDCGLTIEFGKDINRELSHQILCLRDAVEMANLPGLVETVPTYRSLLVHYEPLKTSQGELIAAIRPLLAQMKAGNAHKTRRWTLPICFEKDYAADLNEVADIAKMEPQQVIDALLGCDHYAYMLGFAPGLPYMGDLPEQLDIPRRKKPIPRAEKGSVLIATGLTVIFPVANPTGWYVVGRTPVSIFDAQRADPALISPGDHVSFEQVSSEDYAEIEARIMQGRYQIATEEVT